MFTAVLSCQDAVEGTRDARIVAGGVGDFGRAFGVQCIPMGRCPMLWHSSAFSIAGSKSAEIRRA